MGNWFECMYNITPGAGNETWTDACAKDDIHMDLGLFGFYPLVDRAQGGLGRVGLVSANE